MQDIQLKQVQRALTFFDALGIKYKLITAEGEEFGTLEVKPVRTRRALAHPYGEVRNYYRHILDLNAAIGSVQVVPIGSYEPEQMRGNIGSLLSNKWGKGSYTTAVTSTSIEVLRIA